MSADDLSFDYGKFLECIEEIAKISDELDDGWQVLSKEGWDNGNGQYLAKKCSQVMETNESRMIVVFEYHVTYNINYGVPVLCFVAWKQDGSCLRIEEYCEYNDNFADSDILKTLTQLDHPVLCRPFLTLHPCKTEEIMRTFLHTSKNPVISWMSVIFPFLKIKLDERYFEAC